MTRTLATIVAWFWAILFALGYASVRKRLETVVTLCEHNVLAGFGIYLAALALQDLLALA